MKVSREPALIVGVIAAIVTAALAGKIPHVDAGTAAAVVAAVAAVLTAWRTRPVTPALFVGVLTAGVALVGHFGVHLSDSVLVNVTAILIAGLALVGVRPQVTPVNGGGGAPPA